EAASWLVEMQQLQVPDIDLVEAMDAILDLATDLKTADILTMQVSDYLRVPQSGDLDVMSTYASRVATLDEAPRVRLLSLLAEVTSLHGLFVTNGLKSSVKEIVLASTFAAVNAKHPSSELLDALEELVFASEDEEIRTAALLSY